MASGSLHFVETEQSPGLLSSLEKSAERLTLLLSRHRKLLLVLCTFAYGYLTWHRASRKLFWFDELFTIHIAGLHNLNLIWNALIKGVDFNPPLIYILTWFSQAIVGNEHVGARLPAIVGFWVFCLCLFQFVSMRSTALAGFISMAFPLITPAYWYASEARSHGAVLGLCGLALVCWQTATSRSDRRFWPVFGLFASLTCALLTHGYAFLLIIPLTAGELTRSIRGRRVDWTVWSALGASSVVALISLPLLISARSFLGVGVQLPASIATLLNMYDWLFGPTTSLLITILALICADYGTRRRRAAVASDRSEPAHGFEWYEWTALFAFLTIPFFMYLAARLSGAPMVGRYGLTVVAGAACLVGMIASKRATIGLIVLAFLSAQVVGDFWYFVRRTTMKEPSSQYTLSTSIEDFKQKYRRIADVAPKLPIVLVDSLDSPPIFYYASPEIASRLVYLKTEEYEDLVEKSYKALQLCCKAPGRIASLPEILATNNSFLVYSTVPYFSKVERLARGGGKVSVEALGKEYALFLVTYPVR
jgi:Dolichyl-phosphate-mannose-protein mannosyltransferase